MMRFIACLVLVLLWSGTAFADTPEASNVAAAREAEATARDAFRSGDFRGAAERFATAFRLDPRANTKYNEALAWRKADELAAAADAYEVALTFGGLDAKLVESGTDALATLKPKLGRLIINQPIGATVSVAHAHNQGIPAKIHVAPGAHDVVMRGADGRVQRQTVEVVAASDEVVVFETMEKPAPAVPAPEPVAPASTKTPGLMVAGWTTLGLGGATLIAMGVVGGLTLSKVNRYDETGNTDAGLHDEAVTLKTTTNVLIGVGGGLAALGTVLLIIGMTSDDTAAFRPTRDGLVWRF